MYIVKRSMMLLIEFPPLTTPPKIPDPLRYDYQTIDEIVGFVLKEVEETLSKGGSPAREDADPRPAAAPPGKAEARSEEFEEFPMEGRANREHSGSPGGGGQRDRLQQTKHMPSSLLKVLRPPAVQRPLFLAAPGVANAQVTPTLHIFVSTIPSRQSKKHSRKAYGRQSL